MIDSVLSKHLAAAFAYEGGDQNGNDIRPVSHKLFQPHDPLVQVTGVASLSELQGQLLLLRAHLHGDHHVGQGLLSTTDRDVFFYLDDEQPFQELLQVVSQFLAQFFIIHCSLRSEHFLSSEHKSISIAG